MVQRTRRVNGGRASNALIAVSENAKMGARRMDLDLRSVFVLASGQPHALEFFIGQRLYDAEEWKSPRSSDGVSHVRVVEYEPERVRVCGKIWHIDQTLHEFWLDVERDGTEPGVTWALYFDVVAPSARQARHSIDLYDRAEDIEWRVTLKGRGEVRDGKRVVIC